MVADEVSIDFTTEELLVLESALQISVLPPGPGGAGQVDGLPGEPVALLDHARRALRARRILRTDSESDVNPAVAQLLQIVGAPLLVLEVARAIGKETEHTFFTAVPELAVEHRWIGEGLHRLTPFPANTLMSRALTVARLEGRKAIAVQPMRIAAGVATDAFAAAQNLDHAQASRILQDAGVPVSDVELLVNALTNRVAAATITVVHRPAASVLEGGEVAWVDGGRAGGLWLMPTVDELLAGGDTSLLVEVRPTSTGEIRDIVRSFLPV